MKAHKDINKERRQAQIFKALSDETRLRIVKQLQTGSLCVCEMVEALRIPQYKISKHLMILKYAGLVDCERVGTWAHYFLRKDDPLLQSLFRFLRRFARPELSGMQREAGLQFLDKSAET